MEVQKELTPVKVASGYIQAYRIAADVIKAKGDNKFLGVGGSVGGTTHDGVRADFKDNTNRIGLTRKDGRVFLQF